MVSRFPLSALCVTVLLAIPLNGWAADLSDDSAEERAGELLATLPFFSGEGRGRYRMVVEGQNGERFEREIVVETKEVRGSVKRRIDVVSPADLVGRAFLFVSHPKKPDEYWVRVPAFETTRQIDGPQRNGSLLRSHLTYRDALGFQWDGATFGEVRTGEVDGESAVHVRVNPGEDDETEYDDADVSVRASGGAPLRCTVRAADESFEKTFQVESWSGSGSTARVEALTVRPSSGGYTRLELREFQPKPTRSKKHFQPEGLAGSDVSTQP